MAVDAPENAEKGIKILFYKSVISKATFLALGLLVTYIIFANKPFSFLSGHNYKKAEQNVISNSVGNSQSVVNIICDDGDGGSGIIYTKNGSVITNNHVIAKATSCLVTIPDPTTGAPLYIYESKPLIFPDLSSKYDIAVLKISGSYTDPNGTTWGDYPTTFPAFIDPNNCSGSTIQLGASIRIYGYPITSGGYNLTVTDGLVSSFADDGRILTSAKIDSGNSGGLAVDQDGCFVGIPTAVVSGNYQNLGVIIPATVIQEFANQIPSQ